MIDLKNLMKNQIGLENILRLSTGGGEVHNPREVTIEPGDNELPPTQEKSVNENGNNHN
jgi:hypothetical protein